MIKLNTFYKFLKYSISISFIYTFSIFVISQPNIDKLNIPIGFEINIFADNLDTPRQIAETDGGHIVVGSKKGNELVALVDLNNDGSYQQMVVASGLENPAGVAVHKGDLYFAEMDTVWVIQDIDNWIASSSKTLPERKIYMNNLPSETWHGLKYIDFGPDGNLYIPVGVPCNICLEPQTKDPRFAAIHKYVDGELVKVADGVRNSVGFDWHPVTKKCIFLIMEEIGLVTIHLLVN